MLTLSEMSDLRIAGVAVAIAGVATILAFYGIRGYRWARWWIKRKIRRMGRGLK